MFLSKKIIRHFADKKMPLESKTNIQATCRECGLSVHRFRFNVDRTVTCANCMSEGK